MAMRKEGVQWTVHQNIELAIFHHDTTYERVVLPMPDIYIDKTRISTLIYTVFYFTFHMYARCVTWTHTQHRMEHECVCMPMSQLN